MRRTGILAITALGLTLTAGVAGNALAQDAGEDPSLTIVLDSSRSMWGQIDGVNKVVIARNVLGGVTKGFEGRLDLGLISYGHRESSGCEDIEVLAEPGPFKASEFSKSVNSIKPKGSTPIASSLETAAKAARFTDRKASLLLISDGLDNCSGDPCAVAGALKDRSDDLTIHVVAFDANSQDKLKALSCVAENTGGVFAPATGEVELHAAVSAIFEKALEPPMPAVTQAPEAAPQQAPPATGDARQPSRPAPETQAAAPSPEPERETQPQGDNADPQSHKAARGEMPADDGSGKQTPVSLTAKLSDGGAAVSSEIVWRIYDAAPDPDGKYKLLDTQRTATLNHALAPGDYMINAAYGLANVTRKVSVQAGQSFQDTFILNAGGLRLGAQLENGESLPPNSVRYDIFEGEADQFGNRVKILGDAKPGLIMRLNAGAYHVVSVYGDANAVVRADVAVEPGRLTEATINHSAAQVTFRLVNQPGGEALADTQWNVLTPGGDVVKESAGALPTHVLAAGEYSVLARHQGKNYTREFEVKPGDAQQIEVVIR